MKVLLVNGSPHPEGCTYTALSEVSGVLTAQDIETEIFWIGNKPIGGCIACMTCRKTGKCVFDDVVNQFHEKAPEADGFVFGTPVHYAAASGNMTSFMDRLFYSDLGGNTGKAFYMKPAAAVISARRAGTTATWDQINKYFGLMQMPIVTSQYWNQVHGASPEQVRQDAEGMQIMRTLGRNMAFLLKCIKMGLEHDIELPDQEARVFTNFTRTV